MSPCHEAHTQTAAGHDGDRLDRLAISEWLTDQRSASFLQRYEVQMPGGLNHADMMDQLRQGRHALLANLTSLHVLQDALTFLALVLSLNVVWTRMPLNPIQELLRHTNYMGRGSWKPPIPVWRKDEIGDLTGVFNGLGEQLTLTVARYSVASKLSAVALLDQSLAFRGQSLVRRVVTVRDLLQTSVAFLKAKQPNGDTVPVEARARLHLALETLEHILFQFEVEFDRQFALNAVP